MRTMSLDPFAPENSHVCTPAYRDHMAQVDKLPKQHLARIVKWIIDDIYGVGEGDPHFPRALDNQREASTCSDVIFEITETLNAGGREGLELIPPDYCDCGNVVGLDGYDGKCATCADKAAQ